VVCNAKTIGTLVGFAVGAAFFGGHCVSHNRNLTNEENRNDEKN
jgi:hypothetical protein